MTVELLVGLLVVGPLVVGALVGGLGWVLAVLAWLFAPHPEDDA